MTTPQIILVTLAIFAIAGPAAAIDPECGDLDTPPANLAPDQTAWLGADGDLAYCTSLSTLSTVDVIIDGEVYLPGSIVEMMPPGTYKQFAVPPGKFGSGVFTIATIAVSGEPVPVVTGSVTFPEHLPPVLLVD